MTMSKVMRHRLGYIKKIMNGKINRFITSISLLVLNNNFKVLLNSNSQYLYLKMKISQFSNIA